MAPRHFIALGLVALLWFAPSAAWGADLDVSPVRLHLSASRRSSSLTVVNRGSERLRYQLTASAWQQAPDGEMVLVPTQDLVFFPSLIDLAPGEARRIRVAAPATVASIEATYRILLTALPDGTAPVAGTVAVLTNFSVPVFVQPRAPSPQPVAELRMDGGRFVLSVANSGNSYFVTRTISVVGRSRSGAVLFERELPGWYVLAHGERLYEVPLSADECAALADVTATITTDATSATTSIGSDVIRCGE